MNRYLTTFIAALGAFACAAGVLVVSGELAAPEPARQGSNSASTPAVAAAQSLARRHFSDIELAVLSESERDERPIELHPVPGPLPHQRTWSARIPVEENAPYHQYVLHGKVVEPDDSLPLLQFEFPAQACDLVHDIYPEVVVRPVESFPGRTINYYFEFDTAPTFDSPNFWRWPSLAVVDAKDDATDRRGTAFDLLRSWQHEPRSTRSSCRFPFRVTAMRLPEDWDALTFEELVRHAHALGHGLSPSDQVAEIFAYIRQTCFHGSDTISRNALDVFARGFGECGAVNNLAGAMLELNGIRYRGISGFSPYDRAMRGRSGHSTIEVLHPDLSDWSYFDAYYDFYFPGVSAAEFVDFEPAQEAVIQVYRGDDRRLGDAMHLSDLFAYRKYFDRRDRLPRATMLQLQGREDAYGLQWALETLDGLQVIEAAVPEAITVFVRARYAVAHSEVQYARLADARNDGLQARVSDWATTHFVFVPDGMPLSAR